MKVNNSLIILLVLVGLVVFVVSLYTASLSGVMNKMGIVGGDFSQSIKQNELARQVMSRHETVDCSLWNVVKHVPNYLISKGEKRVELSGELGGDRIVCGVRLVQSGNVERGVYTIVKGLYYLKSHYGEMKVLVDTDKNMCQLLAEPNYERWVEGYILSTDGRINDVVLNVYREVERSRSRVEELCLD